MFVIWIGKIIYYNDLTTKIESVSSQPDMAILVTGKLVIVYGKLLINNKMGYCGLGNHVSEKYIYAPITGLGANNSNISSYGYAYIKPNEDRLNVYLSGANTYAIVCISYICK